MNKKDIYFTSDHALAAFLCTRGYTLLGAVDTGTRETNREGYTVPRYEFAITHPTLYKSPDAMQADILKKIEDYSHPFAFPGDNTGAKVNFRDYHIKLRMCKKALQFPVEAKSL